MRKLRIGKRVMIFAASAVLIATILPGCSKQPTAPAKTDSPMVLKRNLEYPVIAMDSIYTEATISAASGGTLSLMDIQVSIPPGALEQDTLISIFIPDLNVFENHFGTDGLFFNQPVRVRMDYRDADLSGIEELTIKMAWYNEHTASWDIIPCTLNVINKTVTAYVSHFSAYALISD